jgi:hypothetical protein
MNDNSILFFNEKFKNNFKDDLILKIEEKNIKIYTIPAE